MRTTTARTNAADHGRDGSRDSTTAPSTAPRPRTPASHREGIVSWHVNLLRAGAGFQRAAADLLDVVCIVAADAVQLRGYDGSGTQGASFLDPSTATSDQSHRGSIGSRTGSNSSSSTRTTRTQAANQHAAALQGGPSVNSAVGHGRPFSAVAAESGTALASSLTASASWPALSEQSDHHPARKRQRHGGAAGRDTATFIDEAGNEFMELDTAVVPDAAGADPMQIDEC